MMLPTHAVVGLALATPVVYASPELAPVGLAVGWSVASSQIWTSMQVTGGRFTIPRFFRCWLC